MLKKKDISIETLRGIAIILMVMAHVIGTNSSLGLRVPDSSFLRWIYLLQDNYVMPLFTMISGYVYSIRAMDKNHIDKFLKRKINRLFYPLIMVSTLQFLIKYIIPGTNSKVNLSEIWKIYIFSYDQFWFLQAIIIVFLILSILEYFEFMDTFKKWLVVLAMTLLISFFLPFRTAFFSFNGFLYLLPCFILGLGFYRFNEKFEGQKNKIIFGILFLVSLVIQQLNYFGILDFDLSRMGIWGLTTGIIGNVFFFFIKKPQIYLAWIGNYAFDIYLFHVFGQAGSRILFKGIGLNNISILFVINLLFGLLIPILMAMIFKKNKLTRRCFLGLK